MRTRRLATFAGAVAATLVIAGCSSASGTPVHTVRWYTGHDEARVAMVQRCDAQPMKLANTPDCIDAHDAAEDLGVQLAGATTQSAPQG